MTVNGNSREDNMKVGDVMRVRENQDCTSTDACGQLCVIEDFLLNDSYPIRIRIQGIYCGDHYIQHVNERHLEKP